MKTLHHIIISRTDGIGDVILTLPMCGILKSNFPDLKITFLGANYTKEIVACCKHVDAFVSYDDMQQADNAGGFLKALHADAIVHVFPRKEIAYAAKDAQIPVRIGTSHRAYHWISCSDTPNVGRKNSKLHEAQLNIMLLAPLGIETHYQPELLPQYYGFTAPHHPDLPNVSTQTFNLIIHPKSNGSAREWGMHQYAKLIEQLPPEKFTIYITGTKAELDAIALLNTAQWPHVHNVAGLMDVKSLIAFINACNGLLACSTGPLHIAAALGINTLGLYAPIVPVHAARWAPLGKNASYLQYKRSCNDCKNSPQACKCIRGISVSEVASKILSWAQNQTSTV
ncbi:MAG: glycosyltransferase family 9 protein [Bacteroidia bacterium]|nr:glycosyltransferase family 9 protein [Bacteroidia bacterium]